MKLLIFIFFSASFLLPSFLLFGTDPKQQHRRQLHGQPKSSWRDCSRQDESNHIRSRSINSTKKDKQKSVLQAKSFWKKGVSTT
jgi:Ni/Co efflux regulator RcnB